MIVYNLVARCVTRPPNPVSSNPDTGAVESRHPDSIVIAMPMGMGDGPMVGPIVSVLLLDDHTLLDHLVVRTMSAMGESGRR